MSKKYKYEKYFHQSFKPFCNVRNKFRKENHISYNKINKRNAKSMDIFNNEIEIMNKIKFKYFTKGKEIHEFKSALKEGKEEKESKTIKYIKLAKIGKGANGECFSIESTEDWDQYVVKIVDKKKLESEKGKQSIRKEIEIQKSLDFPKIVKVKDYSEDKENVYIILELCKNHSLADLLKQRKYLTEMEVQCYMFQLIQGLKYLHDKNIIHRDLKPSNIFLDYKLELKIGDFGEIYKLAKYNERRKSFHGTKAFMAPEIIKIDEKGYSFDVDIWSIGVIMFNLLTGIIPFRENCKKEELKFPYEPIISKVAKDLIKQILEKDPKKRPGLNQILYHKFFHMNKFPKLFKNKDLHKVTQEIENYKNEGNKNEGNNNDNKESFKLYNLLVDYNPDIKYEDIDKYTLTYNSNIKDFDNWVTFSHVSHFGFVYYELNKEIAGIIYKNQNENKKENKENKENKEKIEVVYYEDLNIFLKKNDKESFYVVIKNDEGEIIKSYNIKNYQGDLREKLEQFLEYHEKAQNKIKEKNNEIKKSDSNENSIYEQKSSKNGDDNNNSIIEQKVISTNIDNNNEENNNTTEENSTINDHFVYVKSYMDSGKAKFFILSDETQQTIFKDKIEILLSEKKEIIKYIDKMKNSRIINLANVYRNDNKEFIKKCKHIRHINFRKINDKIRSYNGQ